MKKLFVLFSFLAISSLLFVSCQSSENITSPTSDLNKPDPPSCDWGTPPTAVNIGNAGEETVIDLVAGQHYIVGSVTVVQDGSNLIITYNTDEGCIIEETHLMVVANPEDFIVNSGCNPKVGQFPDGEEGVNGNSAGPYTVPIPEGVEGGMVYIGAHAVVNCECDGEGSSEATLCPDWGPDNMTPVFHSIDDTPGYVITATFTTLQGTWNGWCVDNTREISSGNARNVDFICSYDGVPTCTTFVEYPDRLDRVNWLINNLNPTWGKKTIQAAIWKIINPSGTQTDWQGSTINSGEWPHNPTLRDEIYDLAMTNGAGFVPDCGDKVLILVYATGPDGTREPCDAGLNRQVVAIEKPIECHPCGEQTAWAFNYPTDETSNEFPGANWFRYFGYLIAED